MPKHSTRRGKRLGAIASAVVLLLYAAPLAAGTVATALAFFQQGVSPRDRLLLLVCGGGAGFVTAGILAVLRRRLRELKRGGNDDAESH